MKRAGDEAFGVNRQWNDDEKEQKISPINQQRPSASIWIDYHSEYTYNSSILGLTE